MVTAQTLVGVAMMALTVPMIAMFRIARRNSESPGSRGFLIVLSGAALWCVVSGILVVFRSLAAFYTVWGIHLLAANLLAIGWAIMILDYTRRRRVDLAPRHWALLFAVPVATQVLYATNGTHHLVVSPETSLGAYGIVAIEHGPWFFVHAFYNYVVLALSAAVVLAHDFVRAEGLHRRQSGVLLFGAAVAVAASVGFTVGLPLPPYVDPAPFGYLLTMGIWTIGLFRLQLFNLVPIARKTAVDTIPDAIVVVDRDGRIVDVNAAGRDLFDIDRDPAGTPAGTFFADHPDLAERIRGDADADVDTELSMVHGGSVRHFSLRTRAVEHGETTTGTLLVLRDITPLKTRERDLELVKGLLARVLRHNLRNDLQVIRGRAAMIAEGEGDPDEHAAEIVELCDELAETTENARRMEGIVERGNRRVDLEVCGVVENAARDLRDRFPGADVETTLPSEAWATAHYDLRTAVANLVENAIVHGGGPIDVSVERDGSWVTIAVADEGPGIPDHEIEVLDRGEETPLEHGSGAGLRLVSWIAEASGGDLEFAVSDRGTTATLRLPAVRDVV